MNRIFIVLFQVLKELYNDSFIHTLESYHDLKCFHVIMETSVSWRELM